MGTKKEILTKLEQLAEKMPQFRFGQLLTVAGHYSKIQREDQIFNISDDELLEGLNTLTEELEKVNKDKK